MGGEKQAHTGTEDDRIKAGLEKARQLEHSNTGNLDNNENDSSNDDTGSGAGDGEGHGNSEEKNEKKPDGSAVTLPIGFILKDGTVSKTVYIKKMTGRVRSLLASPECRNNGGRALTTLLRQCVIGIEGVWAGDITDPENDWPLKMAVGDRDALALAIRKYSIDDILDTTIDCPNENCRQPIDIVYDLNLLEFKPVEETKFKPEGRLWVGKFKDGKLSIKFKLPDGRIQEKVSPIAAKNPVAASYAILQACLIEFNGETNFSKKFVEDEMDLADLDTYDKIFSAQCPGMAKRPDIECEVCGVRFPFMWDMVDFLFRQSKKRKA